MQFVKDLTKGQVVIPVSIRKKYSIHPGCEIQIFEYGNLIYVNVTKVGGLQSQYAHRNL